MRVTVNGDPRDVGSDTTVADLVAALGAPERGTAVAVAGAVVPRAEWAARRLCDGEQVELVRAVQGG